MARKTYLIDGWLQLLPLLMLRSSSTIDRLLLLLAVLGADLACCCCWSPASAAISASWLRLFISLIFGGLWR